MDSASTSSPNIAADDAPSSPSGSAVPQARPPSGDPLEQPDRTGIDPGRPEPPPFVVPGDPVTRLLCAAVHLKASFANHVHNELVEPAHRAMAPNWNIDTLALVRHAEQARQRRVTRDLWLLVVFAVTVAVAEWATASVLTGRLGAFMVLLIYAVGLLLSYAASFAIVWWHYAAVHRSAVAVVGVRGVEAEEPPPLDPKVEESLAQASRANVMLFSGNSPFVGSGEVLDRWTLTVDISQGRLRPDGERDVPQPFDSLDLHEALLAELPESISPRPKGGHRLYVVGGHAAAVGGLFRAGPLERDDASAIQFRRPVTVIPEERIKNYMRHPMPSARPYTYFELTGWDGQVVVSLFLRTVVRYPMLFVEMTVTALRPLRDEFGDVATIRLGPGVHRMPVLRSVLPRAFPLMFGSPRRALAVLRGNRADEVARKDLEQTLAERGDVNFAAGPSLREEVARGTNGNHFGYMDEQMYYRVFNRRSLDCVRDYLKAMKVDITDFEKQQTVIVENTIVNARTIYGAGVANANATAGD